MDDDRIKAIHQHILDCSTALFRGFRPRADQRWLAVDLTMPQFKALMCVVQEDGATSGQIARGLGVGLSTITGIVDRLAEHDLVCRREDPDDRRVTRVIATPHGRALVDQLWRYRNEHFTMLLSYLNQDQLRTVDTAFEYLLAASAAMAESDRQTQEVVA